MITYTQPELIEQTGLSITDLSDFLGVSKTMARNFKSGDAQLFPDQLGEIVQLLDDIELHRAWVNENGRPMCPFNDVFAPELPPLPFGSYLRVLGLHVVRSNMPEVSDD